MRKDSKAHLVPKVDQLIKKFRSDGKKISVAKACKQIGMSVPTYYSNKKPKSPKAAASRAKSSRISKDSVVLLVVPPKQARAILKQMAALV